MTWRIWYKNGRAILATRMEMGRVKWTEPDLPPSKHWKMSITSDKHLPATVALIHSADGMRDVVVSEGELPPKEAIEQ